MIVSCPYCGRSDAVHVGWTEETLLGWNQGPNPNHFTRRAECMACHRRFSHQWRPSDGTGPEDYAVIDDQRRVISGTPPGCCFDNYSHRCECGGWKTHSTVLSGKGFVSFELNASGRSTPKQPMYWECDTCKARTPDRRYGTEFMELKEVPR
jgi:hypothetical protein